MNMKKGFTLIEIMIVVAIIAILAAVAIPNFISYRAQSQKNACLANQKALLNAVEAYSIKHDGAYPATIDLVWTASNGDDFLKAEPKCPSGGTYKYTKPEGNDAAKIECEGATTRTGYEHGETADTPAPTPGA